MEVAEETAAHRQSTQAHHSAAERGVLCAQHRFAVNLQGEGVPLGLEDHRIGAAVLGGKGGLDKLFHAKVLKPDADLAVLEASTSLIALDMIKKISMYEMENNHKATFLDDLLVHDEERQRKSLANAEYFDFDVDAEHRVAVIRVLSGSSTIGNSSLYKTNNSIVNILRRISRDSSIKVLFVNKCDSNVLVFESPLREDEEYRRLLQAFIDTALSSLEAEGILAMASIGVGRSYADATSLWKSFNEARRAAACWNIDNSRVHYFEKLGVYRFLSYENLRPELIIFYNETLKVLVDYDHDRDSELVHTLSLYFKCGGNLKRLAEEMGVHYNTVAYRIQRIKELAHVSFDNADQMLNLQIALKIYEVNFHR